MQLSELNCKSIKETAVVKFHSGYLVVTKDASNMYACGELKFHQQFSI